MKHDTPNGSRAFIKRGDLLVILCLLLAAGILYGVYRFSSKSAEGAESLRAEITCDGKLVKTVGLSDGHEEIFSLKQRPDVTFEVKQGKIRFIDAQCPDKLCENAGFLESPNQTAACLPNRVAVRIVGGRTSESDVDIVAG